MNIVKNKNQDARYICTIDNKDWYGSDFKMDLPKNELKLLVIYIKGKYIELDISQMFNPNLTGALNNYQFKLTYYAGFYLLYGFFSDGAGAYTAQWKIQNGKTDRIKLSNEDKDFKWQNIK
ncbi:hypothetical protein CHA01nite_09550 [Chryseobacterium hagamense]|uniref:Uncharacterized protein n=1 Tax=Chryseobacterium hagamense TaxID=395935 RepID=A0A511YJ35_9FLAO|nr:hypothetical protein CHA01nite_09550 [Chryseobacterium hagamense]